MNNSDSNNPFSNYIKNFINPDMSNFMKNMPSFDSSNMTEMFKKNGEMINNTNQIIAKNMQEIFKKSSELMQYNADNFFNFVKEASTAQDFDKISTKGQQLIKDTLQKSLDSSKDIVSIATSYAQEIFDSVKDTTAENIKEGVEEVKKKSESFKEGLEQFTKKM